MCCRPMNASSSLGTSDSCHVEDQVAYLPVEGIGRAPAKVTIRLILIAVDEAKADEARGSFEDGHAIRVANDLRVVVVDDGCGDNVSAGREVDNGRRDGRCGPASWSETATTADGCIDGCSIVGNTVTCILLEEGRCQSSLHTLGSVVFDVTEDLIACIAVERCYASMSNGLHPKQA